MRPDKAAGAPRKEGAGKSPATRETGSQDTRPRRPTQTDLVLRLFMENDAVCSSEFYRRYLPRFGARIWELRRAGYVIHRSKCDDPTHLHRNRAFAYELVALPYDPTGKVQGE